MEQVTALHPRERIHQDGEVIAAIYRNLGRETAEAMLTRAFGELALSVATMAKEVHEHHLEDLPRQLQKLRVMAESLGMTSLADCTRDVRLCLERSDGTSFAAVWARLLRVAERSLRLDRGFVDISG